ncbi:DUF559 domain-containing protein [Micromonospora cremea]|uniref:DUF559 domain-containing protein n=1 Tax=Micromonospora cremea TaxID=709881 RepID=A0A1N5ZVA8_9ACTN|nr:DUF559 domain-containing protein [Micromonospora cremea]SIN25724.1 Protein of unknown function [Micromonospora cremea]
MDLYSQAAELPWRIPIDLQPTRYRQLLDAGLSPSAIRWRSNRGRLHRPYHGRYIAGPDVPGLSGRARAALMDNPEAVLGFHSAAQLHGFGIAPTDNVHLLTPAGRPFPQRRGITSHQTVLSTAPPVFILGLPCARAPRVAVDLARTLPRLDALPVLDAALFAGAVTPEELLVEVSRHDGLRGVRQARELVAIADGRAECRQETELRLLLIDAGIRDFVPQLPVRDGTGRVRCRLDLGDPCRMIAAEYDGSSHLNRHALRRDRSRHNWLEQQGWAMRYFTAADLYHSPENVLSTITTARRSRANRRT